jgi:hypothetical protein
MLCFISLQYTILIIHPVGASQRQSIKTAGRWHKVDTEQSGCKFETLQLVACPVKHLYSGNWRKGGSDGSGVSGGQQAIYQGPVIQTRQEINRDISLNF